MDVDCWINSNIAHSRAYLYSFWAKTNFKNQKIKRNQIIKQNEENNYPFNLRTNFSWKWL